MCVLGYIEEKVGRLAIAGVDACGTRGREQLRVVAQTERRRKRVVCGGLCQNLNPSVHLASINSMHVGGVVAWWCS